MASFGGGRLKVVRSAVFVRLIVAPRNVSSGDYNRWDISSWV